MPQIDPMLSLAITVHSAPGVHGLLLGSGVSKAAGILTGWEIVLDLARQLAKMQGEEPGADPAAWYRDKYGHEPDYSELLEAVAKTSAERQQLLRAYFEPTEDERSQGLKQPTPAHLAVAKLVARGSVKVILTTNFDHLLERAIEGEGITPTIVSTADAIDGIMPLIHQRCCIIKLHGDYLDTRILNTPAELAKYPKVMNTMLDRIFDEFGMIVCGWSGQWDTALRAAIERCKTRRFSWHWMSKGQINEEAERLVRLRGGHVLQIDDANSAFQRLGELVEAVEESRRPAPESMEVAVSLLKRYLPDPVQRVRLHDLIVDEADQTRQRLDEYEAKMLAVDVPILDLFDGYLEFTERLETLLVHGCALGETDHHRLWINVLQRVFPTRPTSGRVLQDGFRHYPILHMHYVSCMAALAAGRTHLLADLLLLPQLPGTDHRMQPLIIVLDRDSMYELMKATPRLRNFHLPVSEHLYCSLHTMLRRYVPTNELFDRLFDYFEHLIALVHVDLTDNNWAPLGRFAVKMRRPTGLGIPVLVEEAKLKGVKWPLLTNGLFGGEIGRFDRAREAVDKLVLQSRFY